MHIISRIINPSKFKIKWEKTPKIYVTFCYVNAAEIVLLLLLLLLLLIIIVSECWGQWGDLGKGKKCKGLVKGMWGKMDLTEERKGCLGKRRGMCPKQWLHG